MDHPHFNSREEILEAIGEKLVGSNTQGSFGTERSNASKSPEEMDYFKNMLISYCKHTEVWADNPDKSQTLVEGLMKAKQTGNADMIENAAKFADMNDDQMLEKELLSLI